MNAFLTQRQIAQRSYKTCVTRNSDKPIAGWLIALVIVGILAFGVATDVGYAIAWILQ